MTRGGKSKVFFYLEHRTVDNKYSLIVDSFVTPDYITDDESYTERIDTIIEKYKFKTKYSVVDAGIFGNYNLKQLPSTEFTVYY